MRFFALFLLIAPLSAQFVQQGPKLTATGAVGLAYQGNSVALSADGNTAVVGGYGDDGFKGAAWVWTRNGDAWTQGPKLFGSGAVGNAYQGYSVALSADGNTALVGGPVDSNDTGAVWVWVRNAGAWVQQGQKLVGTGSVGFPDQGYSVSLSADGNTALIGGDLDSSGLGAVWVFTRSGGVWTQQGQKLVGTGAVGTSVYQGYSVSLSGDGNTAVVGALGDDNYTGAVWVWIRSGGVWTQQGSKLVGTGTVGPNSFQGFSVAVSSDGNTLAAGRPVDNNNTGAVWIWTRSVGLWSQQGEKLVAPDAIGPAFQGISVALSSDGSVATIGGDLDNGGTGAVWVWTRTLSVWTEQQKLVSPDAAGKAFQGYSVALSANGATILEGGLQDNRFVGAVFPFAAPIVNDAFQVRYTSLLNVGDSVINFTNTGTLTLPGALTTSGNICVNVYTFDASEELVSCCSCLVTPNGLNSLSARTDLISNTLTAGTPTSIVIKLLATTPLGLSSTGSGGTCNASSPTMIPAGPGISGSLVPGMLAWGTTIHERPTVPVTYGVTEERFAPAELSTAELSKLVLFCGFIQANGSGYGICKSCRTGGLGGQQR